MPRRARLVSALVVLALAGCSGADRTARPTAAPAAQVLKAHEPVQEGPSATISEVELQVTAAHLIPGTADDAGARSAAERLGVPVSGIVQMHLVLGLRNTGRQERDVSGDAVQLGLGTRWVAPVPGDVFPRAPLAPGQEQETAVGFWVAPRAGSGPVTLRWTSDGRTAVLPLDQVRTSP